jgi:hypothetical protein
VDNVEFNNVIGKDLHGVEAQVCFDVLVGEVIGHFDRVDHDGDLLVVGDGYGQGE